MEEIVTILSTREWGNCHMGYRILCMDVDSKGNP